MASRIPMSSLMRVLDSPDLARRAVRSAIRKRITSQFDYYLRQGWSAAPVQLDIKIINACNLRCKMCAQWGENGYNFVRPSAEVRDVVPLEVYRKLMTDVSSFKPWIYIWGGEPFLYPDFMTVLTEMKERDFTVSVVTNGTKLEKHTRELVEIGTDVMMFSIDGPRETHDNIRGYQGAFDTTVAGIKAIQEEKKGIGRAKPYVVLISVVTHDNEHNLEEVFELGEELGTDMMLVYYGWFQTPESGQRHTQIMRDQLDVTPWSWRGWVWSVNQINPEIVLRSVQRIKARRWSFPYLFFPDLKPEEVARYYREHSNSFGHSKCVSPWVMAELMPNGDMVTCRDYPDFVVGNIKQDSILEIWNNERSRRFRSLLKQEGGLLPVCTRCQGLMGW